MNKLSSYYKASLALMVIAVAVVANLTFTGSADATGNLVVNGSFESGQYDNPAAAQQRITYYASPAYLPNWTVTGEVDRVSTAFTASDQDYSLDMNGFGAGGINQFIPTVPGQEYRMSFDLAGNPDTITAGCENPIRTVSAYAGVVGGSYTFDVSGTSAAAMGWVEQSFNFTATATSTQISFNSGDSGKCGAAIDNVSVVAVGPPVMFWADWTGGDLDAGSAFQGVGTITSPTAVVNVRYDNPQGILDVPSDSATPTYGYDTGAVTGGLDRWGRNGDNARVPATSPYTSDDVANIPTDTDMIRLRYAGSQTLTFIDAAGDPIDVANPVFAFVSLNLNGYGFDQDFDILSQGGVDGNDCGLYGCGTSTKQIVDNGGGDIEYWLVGTGEPHGTIRFRGSFDTLNWESLGDEVWNGFNVGIAGLAEELPDTDGDGYSDDVDVFPTDGTEWADFDGDGVGDNADAFPHDPNEDTDTDGDGIGDNADPGPDALGRTGWEMFGPNPIVSPVPNYGTHGDDRYYNHVGPVPAAGDSDWGPAPDSDVIGFSVPSRLNAPYVCLRSLDYTFFQTFVDIPIGTDLTTFSIDFSGMDDGSRVTVYNSLYPGGLVITGSSVGLNATLSLDLTSFMNIGETNRVLVTQIDDCATGNNLHSAIIKLNGTTIEPPVTNLDPELTSVGTAIDEGSVALASGTVSDEDGDTVALSASVGTVENNNNGTWSWTGAGVEADGPASYDVTITGDDGEGGSASTVFTVTVFNVDPVVHAGNDAGINEGETFTSSGLFDDPGADTWTATVDYGDGSGTQALALSGYSFDLAHTYVDNGVYTVVVTVTDDENGVDNDTVTVSVRNVAPVVDPIGNITIDSGETVVLGATFSDAGVNDVHTASVDWAGSVGSPVVTDTSGSASGSLSDSQQFFGLGDHTVTVTVTDNDGAESDAVTFTVTVLRAAIDIDVKPGSDVNPLNLNGNGVVPIAVLGSAEFDVSTLISGSVLAGAEGSVVAAPVHGGHIEDVNGDGFDDYVFHFREWELGVTGDALTRVPVYLTAESTDGVLFGGEDDVRINPNSSKSQGKNDGSGKGGPKKK
ncbi:DUF642 domain-containing protein [SAR202 cluster bacterium JH702]|uniref:DUF642 domain-containing protein n=1 Tax=Candidatus Lucifugimonas marina TaxID=3038979 RepID=A0ABD4XSQ3_9CHLR|nr:DUF642 domain-containing protein [SAR202 cluster bacterium JH702]